MKITASALIVSFLLLWLAASWTAPESRYPYLAVHAADGVEVHVLQQAMRNEALCRAQLNVLRDATRVTCPTCKILDETCQTTLSIEQADWLSRNAIDHPSAAYGDNIIVFKAAAPSLAQKNCAATAALAEATHNVPSLECYPADTPRPKLQDKAVGEGPLPPAKLLGFSILGALLCILLSAFFLISKQGNRQPTASWPEKIALASTDASILMAAFLIVSAEGHITAHNILVHLGLSLTTVGWLWIIKEHYARRRPFWNELRETFRTLMIILLLATTALLQTTQSTVHSLVLWLSAFALIPLGRTTLKHLLHASGRWERPAVIIGTGENAREAYKAVQRESNLGYRITGFIAPFDQPDTPENIHIDDRSVPVIPLEQDVAAQLVKLGNPQIIIGLDSLSPEKNQQLIQKLSRLQNNVHIIPTIRGLPLFGTEISHFFSHEVLFMTVRNNLARRSYRWLKRGFDLIAASILIVLLTPLMAYVAFRIWKENGRPVIFKQERVGFNGQRFGFIKFRSMVKDADRILEEWKKNNSPEWQAYYANNFKLANDPRVLSVGQWIRGSSIDELPQLINVIKGEMSLVGPRPLLPRELEDYGAAITLYQESRPGLTGLWQISGRSNTTFKERANLDSWYVQNWSLWYDIAILFKTIDVVFNRKGAY